MTLGALDGTAPPAEQPSSVWGDIDPTGLFAGDVAGSNITVNDVIGGAWCIPFPGLSAAGSHVAFAGEDLRICIMQITTAGTLSGQCQVQVFMEGDQQDGEFRDVFEFGSCPIPGCTDETACNFDMEAEEDDGSCTYILEGECDCDGNVVDECGICGGTGILKANATAMATLWTSAAFVAAPAFLKANATAMVTLWTSAAFVAAPAFLKANATATATLWTSAAFVAAPAFLKVNATATATLWTSAAFVAAPAFLKANATATATLWTSAAFVAALAFLKANATANVVDECGICGGTGIPEGECDCDGNVVDECGICGGTGIPEGECDCDGNVVDECGICGGTGIPEGECDCDGNVGRVRLWRHWHS